MRTFDLPKNAGDCFISVDDVALDGEAYAYSDLRIASTLFLVSGL